MLTSEQLNEKLAKPLGILKAASSGHIIKRGLLMKEFSKVLRVIEAFTRRDETICVKGCYYCCYCMPVLKSKMEFEFVKSAIAYNVVLMGPWLRDYGKRWEDFSAIMGPLHPATLEAWRGARIPCPMLKNNSCAIYENRPITCRVKWTPQFYLATCFPGTPIYPMESGPTTDSAYYLSDQIANLGGCFNRRVDPNQTLMNDIEGLFRNIDKWVYNYEGNPTTLAEAMK